MRALSHRPKFFIDENLPHEYADLLRRPFKSAIYSSYRQEDLSRTNDVDLFPVLRDRGFTAIVTQDKNQLFYEEERAGLREAGLHWIGLRGLQGRGMSFHSQAISIIATALPGLIAREELEPHAFFIAPDNARPLHPLRVEKI